MVAIRVQVHVRVREPDILPADERKEGIINWTRQHLLQKSNDDQSDFTRPAYREGHANRFVISITWSMGIQVSFHQLRQYQVAIKEKTKSCGFGVRHTKPPNQQVKKIHHTLELASPVDESPAMVLNQYEFHSTSTSVDPPSWSLSSSMEPSKSLSSFQLA